MKATPDVAYAVVGSWRLPFSIFSLLSPEVPAAVALMIIKETSLIPSARASWRW